MEAPGQIADGLQEYFQYRPPRLEGLRDNIDTFLSRAEYSYGDADRLLLTHATVREGGAFLLDLDLVWDSEHFVSQSEAAPIVDRLREKERRAFEELITDRARDLFDAN